MQVVNDNVMMCFFHCCAILLGYVFLSPTPEHVVVNYGFLQELRGSAHT